MSSALYKVSEETRKELDEFKENSSQKTKEGSKEVIMQAAIYSIDKDTLEIKRDSDNPQDFESLEAIAEVLGNLPRYIVVSYPLTLLSGLKSVPYVLLYYRPTCNEKNRVMYVNAKDLMQTVSGVKRVLDMQTPDDLKDVPVLLGGDKLENWKPQGDPWD